MNFLFCSLDSPGFLFPLIGIARELRARGHGVAFVTGPASIPFLAAQNLERIPRGDGDGPSFEVRHWFQPLSVAIQIKHIEYALGRFPADALVGQQLTLGPLLVRQRRRLPLGLVGFCTYPWPSSDDLAGKTEKSVGEARLLWRHQDMLRWLNQARQLIGLPPCEDGCRRSPLLGDLFLLRSIPELQPDAHLLPEQVHWIGSCQWEPETTHPELAEWLGGESGTPVVYVQPGRSFGAPSFWTRLVQALGGTNHRVVASVGRLEQEIGDLPGNFFVRPHISQGQVLPRARAVVASATTTATLGALTAGLPSVLIPSGGEQPDVAEACERAGVGVVLNPDEVTPESLRKALEEVLSNTTYRSRAASLRAAFRKLDSFQLAAGLCERLAEGRGPVLRSSTPEIEPALLGEAGALSSSRPAI